MSEALTTLAKKIVEKHYTTNFFIPEEFSKTCGKYTMIIDCEEGKSLLKKEVSKRFNKHVKLLREAKSDEVDALLVTGGIDDSNLPEFTKILKAELASFVKPLWEKSAEIFDQGLIEGVNDRGPGFDTFKHEADKILWESRREQLKENFEKFAESATWTKQNLASTVD